MLVKGGGELRLQPPRLIRILRPGLRGCATRPTTDPESRGTKLGPGSIIVGPRVPGCATSKTLRRIKSLVIPPAWSAVWISPDPLGHIQVTGRDQRGRKQYRYHPRWREVRDEAKYGKTLMFARVLPLIRARVDEDLRRHGLPCERVLAAIVRLLELTLFRIGNGEYAMRSEERRVGKECRSRWSP